MAQQRVRSQRGMTLVELFVALTLSSIIAGMIISATMANREVYQRDVTRTRVNQNIRSALDIIGNEIRQAGERFPNSFPAVLITDNGTNPDELVLRRNLRDDVLVGCSTFVAGANYTQVLLSKASATTPACTYPNQSVKLTSWQTYVTAQASPPKFYIFNQTTRNGEWLKLNATVGGDSGTALYTNFQGSVFTYPYTAESTSLYLMNEWRFRVLNGVLQIVENGDTTNARNVVDGISAFTVQALMQDGTTKTSFINTDSWTLLKAIRVSITGSETMPGGKKMLRTVTSDFFPRNILSN